MKCASCGFADMEFRTFNERIGEEENAITVHGLKGYVCPNCNEAIFDSGSYARFTHLQSSWLKQQKEGEVQKLRRKLNVTQRELAEMMGVGTLAVSRYERGATTPPGPFLKLLRLISNRPELLAELRSM